MASTNPTFSLQRRALSAMRRLGRCPSYDAGLELKDQKARLALEADRQRELEERKAELGRIFSSVSKQSGYHDLFLSEVVDESRPYLMEQFVSFIGDRSVPDYAREGVLERARAPRFARSFAPEIGRFIPLLESDLALKLKTALAVTLSAWDADAARGHVLRFLAFVGKRYRETRFSEQGSYESSLQALIPDLISRGETATPEVTAAFLYLLSETDSLHNAEILVGYVDKLTLEDPEQLALLGNALMRIISKYPGSARSTAFAVIQRLELGCWQSLEGQSVIASLVEGFTHGRNLEVMPFIGDIGNTYAVRNLAQSIRSEELWNGDDDWITRTITAATKIARQQITLLPDEDLLVLAEMKDLKPHPVYEEFQKSGQYITTGQLRRGHELSEFRFLATQELARRKASH